MNVFHHIQSSTGATRSEVVVVLSLIGVLLLGHIIGRCGSGLHAPGDVAVSHIDVLRRLDSILAASESSSESPASGAIEPPGAEMTPESGSQAPRRTAPIGRINLNTASTTQLQRLPGVGQATADRIVEHRRQTPFRRPEDVMLIRGIGEKKYAKMQPFIAAP